MGKKQSTPKQQAIVSWLNYGKFVPKDIYVSVWMKGYRAGQKPIDAALAGGEGQ
jgi:hypothetical protein